MENHMTESSKDLGVAMALLERFTHQRLPRAQALKEKIDQGGRLDEFDITFLHEVFETAEEIKPLVDHHPEYQEVYARGIGLYQDIMKKALENEQGSNPPA